jgi:hypothetical protein
LPSCLKALKQRPVFSVRIGSVCINKFYQTISQGTVSSPKQFDKN